MPHALVGKLEEMLVGEPKVPVPGGQGYHEEGQHITHPHRTK